jgi:peptide/nickel transport system ATP-binding protein
MDYSTNKEILRVKDLSISFTQYNGLKKEKVQTIHSLNLSVNEGEIVAVVGASGSGKSLLAHSILGILPYNASMNGEIYFYDNLLTEEKKKEYRGKDIVLIPQSVSYLNPLIKIGSQIRKGDNSQSAKNRCLEILKKYKLDEKVANMYPFQLSGGMTRRVLISTAVYSSPKLILADEPTPGLDPRTLNHIAEHFQELANEGMGILIITHDLDVALKIANRIVVFYDGVTIEDLCTDDFCSLENLNHPYTKALFHAMPQNGFHSFSLDTSSKKSNKKGCSFYNNCSHANSSCLEEIPWKKTKSGFVRCILEKEEKNAITSE